MPVGIEIPQVRTSGVPDAAELTDWFRQVEQAGFHSAWAMEGQLGAASSLDPFSTLAFAAGQTTTLRLGLAVAVLPLHQPVRLARQATTIDRLSGGRLTLDVGIGAPILPHEAFGRKSNERAARFEEYVEVMRRLWTEPEVSFQGRFLTLRQGRIEPKPVQQPLPLWFGASSPPALRRTARLADGWIGAGSTPSAAFPPLVSQLREQLEAEGRDPSTFAMAKRAYVAIDRPPAEVAEWFQAVYGGGIPPEVAISGSVEQLVDELRTLRDSGAELLVVAPVGDDRPQLAAIVEHVLPALG